jgi:hypothetical protein
MEPMVRRNALGMRLLVLGWAALMLAAPTGMALGGALIASDTPALFHLRNAHTTTSSTNWAGWAVKTKTGAVSDVKGSWVVPKIQGSCPSTSQYSSFWVGIDGYSSSSVEQTGTDSDCQGGSPVYYAWYEFYPSPAHLISTITITPGDYIVAEVSFASSKFTVKLTDLNTSKSFSKSASVTASRNSAEWIAEAPSSSSGILPLADFGKVHFGPKATGVAKTGSATVGNVTKNIGNFLNVVQITMNNKAGTATKASPSALTPNGASFNVTWLSAGP